jgi:hypothetical protein
MAYQIEEHSNRYYLIKYDDETSLETVDNDAFSIRVRRYFRQETDETVFIIEEYDGKDDLIKVFSALSVCFNEHEELEIVVKGQCQTLKQAVADQKIANHIINLKSITVKTGKKDTTVGIIDIDNSAEHNDNDTVTDADIDLVKIQQNDLIDKLLSEKMIDMMKILHRDVEMIFIRVLTSNVYFDAVSEIIHTVYDYHVLCNEYACANDSLTIAMATGLSRSMITSFTTHRPFEQIVAQMAEAEIEESDEEYYEC